MRDKGISLPVNTLIILAIGIIVILVLMPLISKEMEQAKLLRPENIVRPSLKDGFNKWINNIKEKEGIQSLDDASQYDIWNTYYNTKVNFMGGKTALWRLCQFGLQEKGEDFTFKNCWNYGIKNFRNEPEKQLVAAECRNCWEKKNTNYIYKKEFEKKEPYTVVDKEGNVYECELRKGLDTNAKCTKTGIK